jgi:hypothetical protein
MCCVPVQLVHVLTLASLLFFAVRFWVSVRFRISSVRIRLPSAPCSNEMDKNGIPITCEARDKTRGGSHSQNDTQLQRRSFFSCASRCHGVQVCIVAGSVPVAFLPLMSPTPNTFGRRLPSFPFDI